MKEYIVLTFIENILIFDYKTITKDENIFVNKNSFNVNTLYYDLKYYKKHINKIINLIRSQYPNINTIQINRLITFKYIIELINSFNIQILTLNFLSTIDKSDYELFLNCKSLKIINCYFMPYDIKGRFLDNQVTINMSKTKEISSKFMESQNTNRKDSFYYSKVVNITEDYPELIDDLSEFLKINYKLRAINIYVYSKELISKIVDLVKNDESRNVIVYLHQETDKGNFIVNNFSWLKEISDRCKEEYTCEFRIIYANSFVSKNLFKQLTFNNLKLISILCIYVCLVSLLIYKSYEYIEKLSIDKLNADMSNIDKPSDNIDDTSDEDDNIVDNNPSNDNDEDEDITSTEPKEEHKSKYSFENSLKKLKKINSETVGYLTVPNTDIAYPVVQHSDNGYYLVRDFYKRKASIGWIYMDYRNNYNNLNDNTIIYGHNMANGTMFGSLKKVLEPSFRKKEENMIITLDTEKKQYKFKIFSVYKVDYTTDYLITNFESKQEKKDFINLITKRNTIKTSVKVDETSKIITLSTCSGNTNNNRRLVVHGVLMEE